MLSFQVFIAFIFFYTVINAFMSFKYLLHLFFYLFFTLSLMLSFQVFIAFIFLYCHQCFHEFQVFNNEAFVVHFLNSGFVTPFSID